MQRVIALTILLCLPPVAAWAECSEGDLEGRYTLSAQTRGELGTFWTTCELSVAANGTIHSGTSCVQDDGTGTEIQATIDGGAVALTASCEVTGSIVIGGYESLITDARMSGDKRMVEGEAVNTADGTTVSFAAARLL